MNAIGERQRDTTLGDDIRIVLNVLGRQWRMIAGCLMAALVIGAAYAWVATPAYTSTVQILLDPRRHDIVEGQLAPGGLGSSAVGADTALLESQLGIIQADSVLGRLIAEEGLADDPEFGKTNPDSLRTLIPSALMRLFYGPNYDQFAGQSAQDRAMQKLQQALSVRRVGNTYIVAITVKTASPDKSARLANSLARIYLQTQQQTADQASANAAASLRAQLAQLKADADAAQHAVADYQAANGLLSADNLPLDQQRLRDLAAQATQAALDTETARSALEQARALSRSSSSAALAANALSSPAAIQIRAQLDLAQSEENALAARLGPRHPQLLSAQSRRQSLERSLTAELARILTQAQSAFDAAAGRQQALEARLARAEGDQAEANSASVELDQLTRVAKAKAEVYQSFLARAAQLESQIALPASTATIISEARPASRPSEPRLTVVLGLAAFAGLAGGIGLAWLRFILGGPSLRRYHPEGAPRLVGQSPTRPPQPRPNPALGTSARKALTGLFR